MVVELLQVFVTGIEPDKGIEWGNVISNAVAILALIFTLYSFKETNKSSSKLQKAETRKNWFLTVIIEPQLSSITTFYNNTFNFLEEGVKDLTRFQRSLIFEATAYNSLKVIKISKFQNAKLHFTFGFIELIRSYDNGMVATLTNCLNDLEDIYVTALDAPDFTALDMVDIESRIHQNKSIFFTLLFKEVDKYE